MTARADTVTIDFTESVRAVHVNHGSNRYLSHSSDASDMNAFMFEHIGMIWGGSTDTRDFNWGTYHDTKQQLKTQTRIGKLKHRKIVMPQH